MEAQLQALRQEQRRLLRLAAAVDGPVDELAAELAARAEQIRGLEQALAAPAAPPVTLDELAAEVEAMLAEEMAELRAALAGDPDRYREAIRSTFPDGLLLRPHRVGKRHLWFVDSLARVTLVSPADSEPLLALQEPVGVTLLPVAA